MGNRNSSWKKAGAGLVFGAAAITGVGLASGVLEVRPFTEQFPLGVNHDRVKELKESIQRWHDKNETPSTTPSAGIAAASTTQLEFLASRIGQMPEPYCPDGSQTNQITTVLLNKSPITVCLNTQEVRVADAAGISWLQFTPTLPSVKGQLPADMNTAYAEATPEQCTNAVSALSRLAKELIKKLDAQSGVTMNYETQIVFNPGGTNPCDQAPPIVQHPLQGGGPH